MCLCWSPGSVIFKHNGQIPYIIAGKTEGSMAKHIMHRSVKGKLYLPLILILAASISAWGFAQDGKQGAPPQEPPKGQGPGPKSGGQGGGGVSTGVGVDVGQVIGLFRHHAKVQLQANTQNVEAGQPVSFTTTVTPSAPGLTYEFHWTKDKGSPGQQETTPGINHVYPSPGQYTANVIVYSNGKKVATSNDVNITVQQPTAASVAREIVWRLSLPPNQTKPAAIAANNQCKQPQRWEIVSQPFPTFLHLSGDRTFDVGAHSKREFPVQLDSTGLKEGEYEGTVIVQCVTCKRPECNQERNIINVRLTVEPVVVASVPPAGTNGTPTTTPPTKTPAPVATGITPPPAPSPTAAPVTPGSGQTLATATSDQPQQSNAKAIPGARPPANSVAPASSSASAEPVKIETTSVPATGASSGRSSDQSGGVSSPYSVSLLADSQVETGKPLNFTAQIFPDLPPEKSARYCFSWGDGKARKCQASPTASHIYGSRGKYSASVEVFVEREKLASAIQIAAVMPWRIKLLLILAVILAVLLAASGARKIRKMIKAAVSVHTNPGTHKITPQIIEPGVALHIRCVHTPAVSKIVFTPPSPLAQENKETANV